MMSQSSDQKGMETLAARLRRLRLAKKLSTSELARRAGVSTSTYREWEYGSLIKGEPYLKLASALGISLSELLLGESVSSNSAIVSRIRKAEALQNEARLLF